VLASIGKASSAEAKDDEARLERAKKKAAHAACRADTRLERTIGHF
jgi:hypothetical protein